MNRYIETPLDSQPDNKRLLGFILIGLEIFSSSIPLALAGCASAQFAPAQLNHGYAARTTPEKIELFRTQTPGKKYYEIGAANACCDRDVNVMINLLRKQASVSGGDALIGLEVDSTGGVTASVIRYQD